MSKENDARELFLQQARKRLTGVDLTELSLTDLILTYDLGPGLIPFFKSDIEAFLNAAFPKPIAPEPAPQTTTVFDVNQGSSVIDTSATSLASTVTTSVFTRDSSEASHKDGPVLPFTHKQPAEQKIKNEPEQKLLDPELIEKLKTETPWQDHSPVPAMTVPPEPLTNRHLTLDSILRPYDNVDFYALTQYIATTPGNILSEGYRFQKNLMTQIEGIRLKTEARERVPGIQGKELDIALADLRREKLEVHLQNLATRYSLSKDQVRGHMDQARLTFWHACSLLHTSESVWIEKFKDASLLNSRAVRNRLKKYGNLLPEQTAELMQVFFGVTEDKALNIKGIEGIYNVDTIAANTGVDPEVIKNNIYYGLYVVEHPDLYKNF